MMTWHLPRRVPLASDKSSSMQRSVNRTDQIIDIFKFICRQFSSGERADILQGSAQITPTVG